MADPNYRLSPDQLNAFCRDGFVRGGKVIDNTDSLEANRDAKGQMLLITQMFERSLLYRRLLYVDRLLDIAESLIGPNIQLFHNQALYKPAEQGDSVFWHQDNAYWKCQPATLVSCWLTLDDVDITNGAMHLLPGSHLAPVEHAPSEQTDALLDSSSGLDTSGAVVIDLPGSGVTFHHCRTLHHTPPNRTGRQRRAFAIHYMQPGTVRGNDRISLDICYSRPLLRARI